MSDPILDEGKHPLSVLKRDGQFFRDNLYVGKDNRVYTKVALDIYSPEAYRGRHLANVSGDGTFILGMFGYVSGNKFAVNLTPNLIRLLPHDTSTTTVDGTLYSVYHFEANSPVFYSNEFVVQRNLVYYIYDNFISNGRFPWYMNYGDLCRLFESTKEYAHVYLAHPNIMDMITTMIARDSKDLKTLYRETVKTHQDVANRPPTIIPFENVMLNTHSTSSRLIGAYFGDAINSALVNTSDRVDRIEEHLRK